MKKYYIDWNGNNTPESLPDRCEIMSKGIFETEYRPFVKDPKDWSEESKIRWPVSEKEYRFDLWCKLNDQKMPEGYKLLDCRPAKEGELYLSEDGTVHKAIFGFEFTVPIIEKTDEWITPDDEIAKLRIKAEFKDYGDDEWSNPMVLIYALPKEDIFMDKNGDKWEICRVQKSEVERARKEKGRW